jgi:hypothetical protein
MIKRYIVIICLAAILLCSACEKPESETTGKAKKEDIIFYAQSVYEARREITDRDIWFGMYIENLSGKTYIIEREEFVLEMKQN